MGTRADFYIAQDDGLEWLGSIAWDGYPEGIDDAVLAATTEKQFADAMAAFFADDRNDVTLPAAGWPWPWDNSRTTDFAYVLIRGEGVVFSSFGNQPYWANRRRSEDDDYERANVVLEFPDMAGRKNVAGGERSGLIVVSAK